MKNAVIVLKAFVPDMVKRGVSNPNISKMPVPTGNGAHETSQTKFHSLGKSQNHFAAVIKYLIGARGNNSGVLTV
jgi:hypothetical protein